MKSLIHSLTEQTKWVCNSGNCTAKYKSANKLEIESAKNTCVIVRPINNKKPTITALDTMNSAFKILFAAIFFAQLSGGL